MLKIDKELFQWERGRVVAVEPSNPDVTLVEFYNTKSTESKAVAIVDGYAQIPDELLQYNLPITASACTNGLNGTRVIDRVVLKVIARPKPEGYHPGSTPDDPDAPNISGVDIVFDGGEVE